VGDYLSEKKTNTRDVGSLFVLVTGATGKQGGAVTRALLEKGHRVRALIRDPESFKAKELEKLGAELFKGDFGDALSLQEATKGVDAFFAVTTPFEKGTNFEVKSGYLMEFAANTIGVDHFVYSSIASSDKDTRIPFFESKKKIEDHIRSSKLPYTIVKPVFFMENFLAPSIRNGLREGKILMPMLPNKKLQMINLEDLASFIVFIFERRTKFMKKIIEIASDELSAKECTEELSLALGANIEYQMLSYDYISDRGDGFVKMYKWLNDEGFNVDIQKLHNKYPEINWHSFGDWVKQQYWNLTTEPIKEKAI
jgi:uncharacterized protein YbjT (DUF2867 family)